MSSAGASTADVGGSGCWPGGFEEGFAIEVDDGDLVVVGDDQDLFEGSVWVDVVLDVVELEQAPAVQFPYDGAGGKAGGYLWGLGSLRPGSAGRRRLGAWRLGYRGDVVGGLRGDPSGECLVGPLGVVDAVELIDLGLEFVEGGGERLLVQPAEQGAVKAFVLALGGRLVGLARDRFDAKAGHVVGQAADVATPGRVERDPLSVSRR